MIEELTPTVLSTVLLLVVCTAALLAVTLSAILLWLYRRAVTRAMAASAGHGPSPAFGVAGPALRHEQSNGDAEPGAVLFRRAAAGPWRLALCYLCAGLACALVFAVAADGAYSFRLGLPGFLLGAWIYAWPVVPAMLLIVPAAWRVLLVLTALYLSIFLLLTFWAGTIADLPPMQFGAVTLPARSSATPESTSKLWLVANAAPTLLVLLCFNRWVRSVAPLALAFSLVTVGGVLLGYFALFTDRGVDAVVAVSVATHIHVGWLVAGAVVLLLIAFGAIGWAIARWVARAYRRRAVSDQSLMLDALWLMFATLYAMWLILGGLVWAATAPVAFAVYKLVLLVARRAFLRRAQTGHGLTFLRVFSLGVRSERLLDMLTRHWRHIGSVQMITGPDVARSTVQPHQFLDFISGKLAAHFVRDTATLTRSLADWDRTRGQDGRYGLNNFFCHADSWRNALPELVRDRDVVLMDLRSFSAANAGCIHELEHLVDKVPIDRCLLLVDDTTDRAFLERTLRQAWQALPQDSPNRGLSSDAVPMHRFGAGGSALPQLLRQLCACAR